MIELTRGFAACVAVAFCIAVAGCATQQPLPSQSPKPVPAPVNLSGYPPEFRQGHADGCASARSGSIRRDEARFKSDAQYMQGWQDGHAVCGKRR
ncbi:MAG: hypothetical protein KIT18_01845 [Burkholderiales bacterium]|nr:hypothetical protein [Burkholderiales bacterium]